MTTIVNDIEKRIWERLEQIPDPEVPVITITELGVVRDINLDGDKLTITITPTYNTSTGTVTWLCQGTPSKYMPATCR